MKRIPYSREEKLLVYALSNSTDYRTGREEIGYEKRMKTTLKKRELAEVVNDLLYEGRLVRSRGDISIISRQIRKYRESHPLQTLQNQYVHRNQKA